MISTLMMKGNLATLKCPLRSDDQEAAAFNHDREVLVIELMSAVACGVWLSCEIDAKIMTKVPPLKSCRVIIHAREPRPATRAGARSLSAGFGEQLNGGRGKP